jgi:hypothetical protein
LICRKVVAAKIGGGELAKDVVEDRGRAFDVFVSLDRAARLEAGGGEYVDIISCSEVDLLTADARLLGVAATPVGEAFASRKPGDRGGRRPLPVSSADLRGSRALTEVRTPLP